MKPGMLFAIIMLTAIVLASSFGLHVMPTDPLYNLPENIAANALYVCPADDGIFDAISHGLRPAIGYINIFFFAALMLLFFGWGWALYQNLLKDKFEQKAFDNSWGYTKVLYWAAVIILILIYTPNSYKTVHLKGADGNWVLCEENTPGARPVMADAVHR